ncbi:MAG: hypothetical protein ATN33_05615 [Epulopiscium sp. Nele67-Bin001]|nr:MAG: hypothetical protein ATN33_05615 [Epulopiscium sp. Nele67-Bin001]
MRLVMATTDFVGKVLAYPIYTNKGLIFMNPGYTLTEVAIQRIRNIGIAYIYIEDEIGDTIDIVQALNDTIRLNVLEELQVFYSQIKKKKQINEQQINKLAEMILNNVNISENAVLHNDYGVDDPISRLSVHCLDVAVRCVAGLRGRKENLDNVKKIILSSLLHDIGALVGSDKVNVTSFEMIKTQTNLPPTVYIPILHIHERVDGTGPNKVPRERLYLNSQVLHIANNYSDLVQELNRPYEAMEALSAHAVGKFDLDVFRSIVNVIYCYPSGLMVKITGGKFGIICKQNIDFPTRPVLKLMDGSILDLMSNPSIFIETTLD